VTAPDPLSRLQRAARLWYERDVALDAPVLTLDDIARLDASLDAELEALRGAGDAGWDACRFGLASDDPGMLFAGAALAFGAGDEARVEEVLASGFRSAVLFRGVESALGWIDPAPALPLLRRFLGTASPDLRRVAIAGLAVQRIDPGAALDGAVREPDTPLRSRAVKAVWQVGRRDLVPAIREAYEDADIACRFSACWAGALLARDPGAVRGLMRFAETGARYPDRAVQLAGLCLPDGARAWQRTLSPRLAVLGTWGLGDPAADVPWLLEQLENAALARVAGEAFSFLTGADGLERKEAGMPAAEAADDGLPSPDAAAARAWWQRNESRFERGRRHVLGKPVTPGVLREVLRDGHVRHRTVAATELCLREGGPCFEVRAPGPRQIAVLRRK
jgi:uncharacterized protein (TIGR02270 family)